MTIEEIKRKKQEYGYTNEQMAELSGVPLPTVRKVLSGATKSPRYETIRRLSAVFPGDYISGGIGNTVSYGYKPHFQMLEEPSAAYQVKQKNTFQTQGTEEVSDRYPRQGSYTLEDYFALPDEKRVELIDGVFYDMGAPTTPHQIIGGTVHAKLLDFIFGKKGTCLPFIAPTDVQLDRDNRTIVQPDVMIVCDRSKITTQRIFGAPDFVMEVLSPGTKTKDIFVKTGKYKNAGVREYWIVDVKHETVTKFLFLKPDEEYTDGDTVIRTYGFSEPVPVTVLNEEISIDFSEIAEIYSFLKG